MSTCNRLELQTLGSQPVMPKNLPDHWTADVTQNVHRKEPKFNTRTYLYRNWWRWEEPTQCCWSPPSSGTERCLLEESPMSAAHRARPAVSSLEMAADRCEPRRLLRLLLIQHGRCVVVHPSRIAPWYEDRSGAVQGMRSTVAALWRRSETKLRRRAKCFRRNGAKTARAIRSNHKNRSSLGVYVRERNRGVKGVESHSPMSGSKWGCAPHHADDISARFGTLSIPSQWANDSASSHEIT